MPSFAIVTIDGEGAEPERFSSLLLANAKSFPFASELRLLSSAPEPSAHDHRVHFMRIPKLDYLGYSKFCVERLHEYVPEDFCLLVQPDGFILDRGRWRDEFLDYDYIGAPWFSVPWRPIPRGSEVGNGGFSLRSRRFLKAAANLRFTSDWSEFEPRLPKDCWGNEDLFLCVLNRSRLERSGIRFAPKALARKFSIQAGELHLPWHGVESTFGFHGHELLPKVRTLLEQRGLRYDHLGEHAPERRPKASGKQTQRVAVVELLGHLECLPQVAKSLGSRDDVEVEWILGSSVRRRLRRQLQGVVYPVPQPMQHWWHTRPPWQKLLSAPAAGLETLLGAFLTVRHLRRTRPTHVHLNSAESPLLWPLLAWLAHTRSMGLSMTLYDASRYAPGRALRTLFPFLRSCAERADRFLLLSPHLNLPEGLEAQPQLWITPLAVVDQQHTCDRTRIVVDTSPSEAEALLEAFARLGKKSPELLDRCDIALLLDASRLTGTWSSKLRDRVKFSPVDELPTLMADACYALVALPAHRGYGTERSSPLLGAALAHGVPLLLPEHYAASWQADNVLRYSSTDPVEALSRIVGKSHEKASQAARQVQLELSQVERHLASLLLTGKP